MPWNIVKGDDRCPASKPYAVVGGRTGNGLFGCHDTKESARNQQKALYSQADDERSDDDESPARDDPPVCYILPVTIAW